MEIAAHKVSESVDASFGLGSLTPTMRAEIRSLHHRRPWANLVILLFPLLWFGCAVVIHLRPTVSVRISCTVLIGISIQGMAIVMHEALHGSLFRRLSLNRWIGFAMGVPAFFSITAYKIAHLNHHRHTRTEKDQDELPNFCQSHRQYLVLYYAWFVFGTFLYIFIVPWKALRIASLRNRHRIFIEYALMFSVYAAIVALAVSSAHVDWILWYWLIPAQFAMLLSNVRGLAEHLGTDGRSDPFSRTRTVTSNRLVSFLMLNLNYHLEHHLLPGVPWYHLQRVHHLLNGIYERQHAEIRRSYVAYALECLKKGPRESI